MEELLLSCQVCFSEVAVEIKQYVWDEIDSNSWLVVEGCKGLLVDVVQNVELLKVVRDLEELTVTLTHSHFDHICGLNEIRAANKRAEVVCTELCSINIGNKHKNMSASANAFMAFYSGNRHILNMEPFISDPAEIRFEDTYQFEWMGHKVFLDSFYGHSNDSLIMILDDMYMFSGDTILSIPTVTRFPGGSTEKFWTYDIPKLKRMMVNIVYPGHGAPGRLDDMIATNTMPEKYSEGK